MPTELDNDFVPLALEMIAEHGRDVTFTIVTETYNPATGQTSEEEPAEVVIKATPPVPYMRRIVEGRDIEASDLETYIAASGLAFTVSNGLKVTFDGRTFRVVGFEPIYSGEQVCAYSLQLRR